MRGVIQDRNVASGSRPEPTGVLGLERGSVTLPPHSRGLGHGNRGDLEELLGARGAGVEIGDGGVDAEGHGDEDRHEAEHGIGGGSSGFDLLIHFVWM